jgi:hypothetical protein
MKKTILTALAAIAIAFSSNAQTINDVPVSELNVPYISISVRPKIMSTKVNVTLDAGQASKIFTNQQELKIKDKDGNVIIFNSTIDAVNFLAYNGYKIVSAYVEVVGESSITYIIMEKK